MSILESITSRPCYICDRRKRPSVPGAEMPVCEDCARAYRLSAPVVSVRTPIPDEKTDPGGLVFNVGSFTGYGH